MHHKGIPEDFFKARLPVLIARIAGFAALGVGVAMAFALVFGFVFKWLWNWIMPAVFGLGAITFWQAFGLLILAKLLFGAISHHPHRAVDRFHQHPRKKPAPSSPGGLGQDDWQAYDNFWREKGRAEFEKYLNEQKE